MAGLCEADGKPATVLNTCPVCGRRVCARHLLPYGCAICQGRKTV
ncbi:MAG: hypothetical protein QXD77_00955 [Candidatus Aenigmatarchaeota archaeon]